MDPQNPLPQQPTGSTERTFKDKFNLFKDKFKGMSTGWKFGVGVTVLLLILTVILLYSCITSEKCKHMWILTAIFSFGGAFFCAAGWSLSDYKT